MALVLSQSCLALWQFRLFCSGTASFAAHAHAGRAVAVAARIFGLTLLTCVVAIMVLKLAGAVATAVWTLFQSS